MQNNKRKELFRDTENGKVAGVCAGIANYFNWETWLVRILFITGFIWSLSLFLVVYIAAWLILSKEDKSKRTHHADDTKNQSEYNKNSGFHDKGHFKKNNNSSHEDNESIKVKARVWQAGEPPKKAFHDIKLKFKRLDSRLIMMEQHVTSSNFDLAREIDKL